MITKFSDSLIGIRPFRPDDATSLFEAQRESFKELSPWMPWCHSDYGFSHSQAFVNSRRAEWEAGEHYSFAVEDLRTKRFLGGVGLNFFNRAHNFANLGYWVRTGWTGRGVATAATRLAARFGFEELRLARLELVIATGNVASLRVAEKSGALREGLLRRRLVIHGRTHDAVMFSLVSEDLSPK